METTTLSAIKREMIEKEKAERKTEYQVFNKRVEAFQKARKRYATIN